MNVVFIALDLDLVFSRCHRFRLCVLELFHDNDVMVVDAIRDIDETVVGSRVILILGNGVVLIVYRRLLTI